MSWKKIKEGFGEYEGKVILHHVSGRTLTTVAKGVGRDAHAAIFHDSGFTHWLAIPDLEPEPEKQELTITITGENGVNEIAELIAAGLYWRGFQLSNDDEDVDNPRRVLITGPAKLDEALDHLKEHVRVNVVTNSTNNVEQGKEHARELRWGEDAAERCVRCNVSLQDWYAAVESAASKHGIIASPQFVNVINDLYKTFFGESDR